MIRKYRPGDLDQLLHVWYQSARLVYPFWGAERFEQERRDISEKFLPLAETYVAERDGRVVGFVSLLGNEVGGIFVAPWCQSRGIGRALMDRARAGRDHLELDVFEANESGRAFYDAYGFTVAGQRLDQETGLPVLRLRLPSDRSSEPRR